MTGPIQRGGGLSPFLIFCFLVSAFSIAIYIDRWDRMTAALPAWAVIVLRSIVLLRPLCLLAIWLWSRSGVVGYILLSAVTIFVLLAVGQPVGFVGIGGVAILIALARSKWKFMVWGISCRPSTHRPLMQ